MYHKIEWPSLIRWANENGLTEEQTIFLLALRETENGLTKEFNVKQSAPGLEEQALWAIGSIKANEKRWQVYIRSQSYMSYLEFFILLGGPQRRGWHNLSNIETIEWLRLMKLKIKGIENEFTRECGVGKESEAV